MYISKGEVIQSEETYQFIPHNSDLRISTRTKNGETDIKTESYSGKKPFDFIPGREQSLNDTNRILDCVESEIYLFENRSLLFLHVNKAARENLGYSTDELESLTPLDLMRDFTPESLARYTSSRTGHFYSFM